MIKNFYSVIKFISKKKKKNYSIKLEYIRRKEEVIIRYFSLRDFFLRDYLGSTYFAETKNFLLKIL